MNPRLPLSVCLALVAAACGTTEGPSLRERPPAALCIAVETPGSIPASRNDLRLSIDGATFQELLIQSLQQVDAATSVVAAGSPEAAAADVVIAPQIEGDTGFRADEVVDWWASGGLWLVTWVGGLVTQDYQYRNAMTTTCALNASSRGSALATFRINRPTLTTSFFERNDFLSWPTVQSLVLPPFWTTDDAETTSTALSTAYVQAVAEDLAKRLKGDFESTAQATGDIALSFIAPAENGGELTGANQATLIFRIDSPKPASRVQVMVQGQEWRDAAIDNDAIENGIPYTRVTHDLTGLERGDNVVRVRIELDGDNTRPHTRTLRIRSVDR